VGGLSVLKECVTLLSIERSDTLLLQCRCSVQSRVEASIDIDRFVGQAVLCGYAPCCSVLICL
jgi:hypothetical protein